MMHSERSLLRFRRALAAFVLVLLAIGSFYAVRWVWRDITYWSRSVTVPYHTDSIEACVLMVLPDWPDVSAKFEAGVLRLSTPLQEGLIVKDGGKPNLLRIVVYGHSATIARLGPADEGPVLAYLHRLAGVVEAQCNPS